ncbi:hypothetical protein [Oceaniferula spumae]
MVTALVVRTFTPVPPEHIQHMVDRIRRPVSAPGEEDEVPPAVH